MSQHASRLAPSVFLASSSSLPSGSGRAADPPRRKPLDAEERDAVLALIKAVDLAQETDVTRAIALAWEQSRAEIGRPDGLCAVPADTRRAGGRRSTRPLIYVRAVSRRDGMRASDEHSFLRDWLAARRRRRRRGCGETVFVGPGEMPVGGPAIRSRRDDVAAAGGRQLAVLALQQRAYEKQKAADEAAKKKAETQERDPFRVRRSRITTSSTRRAGAAMPARSSAR